MKLKKEEIEHIAKLSRLRLSDEEIDKYRQELSSILNYVNALSQVDTKGVEPTAQVSGLKDVFREDRVISWEEGEVASALSQGELEKGNVKVKRVL